MQLVKIPHVQLLCSPLHVNQGRTIWKNFKAFFFSLLRRLMERCSKVRNKGEVKVTFVDDIKKDKKKQMGKTLCYNKMETYLSGREDESPFRNSGDRISSSRRVTMSEKLGRLVLSLCQHSIIKL